MIRFEHLHKRFLIQNSFQIHKRKYLHALTNIQLELPPQKTIGIVGESGSGKSTLAKVFMGLYKPSDGFFVYDNKNSNTMKRKDWLEFYREVAMVFQDPYGSLNPRFQVQDILIEPWNIQKKYLQKKINRQQMQKHIEKILDWVGLEKSSLKKFPHQFSGGQRQRIAIARSLVLQPKILVLDEPVSALDVSIQAQIINLLQDLKQQLQLTYLFIAHDLSLVEYISDYVVVMYLGQVVEFASARKIFTSPHHPYTYSLLKSKPSIDAIGEPFYTLEGEIPSPIDLPSHCSFVERCSQAQDICWQTPPPKTIKKESFFYCHYPLEKNSIHKKKELNMKNKKRGSI